MKNYLKFIQGFSLIEVLFAFVITFTLVLGTAQLLTESLLCKIKSDLRFELSELASSKLETIKAFPFDSPQLMEGFYSERIEVYLCQWQVKVLSSNLKNVELECFPESDPERRIRLALYLSRELGF